MSSTPGFVTVAASWFARSVILLGLVIIAILSASRPQTSPQRRSARRTFSIQNNVFLRNGSPVQIISGSIHYQRIHPLYWRDRLQRIRSLGLNTIQFYVPWNLHEERHGDFAWDGFADVEKFIRLASELELMVLVRAGPYICAEWDFGGLPSWLASLKVAGGRTMKLRSSDPNFLRHVDTWWAQLLPRLRPLLWANGGPIVMMQVENEYGSYGHDKAYLRHLTATAHRYLGDDVILYTTDAPQNTLKGSLYGSSVYTVVDFGPSYFWLRAAFAAQRIMNPSGQSPPFCSEYYTGWLTHWGEAMANTSATTMASTLRKILKWGGGTGSVSLYMAHGGSNFGYWAGANGGRHYLPHITSYDYDAPISEAGSVGQPGIGGPSKFQVIRDVIEAHTGTAPPPPVSPPNIAAMGTVALTLQALLLDNVAALAGEEAVDADHVDIMEEYGQRGGLIVYRTWIPVGSFTAAKVSMTSILDFRVAPKDYAQVLVNSTLVGSLSRESKPQLEFLVPHVVAAAAAAPLREHTVLTLDIVIHAMGRINFGTTWDTKGLQSPDVTLNGIALGKWKVYPLQLEPLPPIKFQGHKISTIANNMSDGMNKDSITVRLQHGPQFFRGTFQAKAGQNGIGRHPADTFLATPGFVKGLAFVNGFNLGWYWPLKGPQQRLYIPGPLLRFGDNELALLEVEAAPLVPQGELLDSPDFTVFRPTSEAKKRGTQ